MGSQLDAGRWLGTAPLGGVVPAIAAGRRDERRSTHAHVGHQPPDERHGADHHGDHEHPLDDEPRPLESYDHVQGGAPVLDIGGDIGAMVAVTDIDALGTELHLRSEHEPPLRVHTGVWERRLGTEKVAAAVFSELIEGIYWVLDEHGKPVRRVRITGGELTHIDLRRPGPTGPGAKSSQHQSD
jgi:hypothetical protein